MLPALQWRHTGSEVEPDSALLLKDHVSFDGVLVAFSAYRACGADGSMICPVLSPASLGKSLVVAREPIQFRSWELTAVGIGHPRCLGSYESAEKR